MNVNIIFVLDESGSMNNNTSGIIKSVNNFVKEQTQTSGKCLFSLIKFSSFVVPLWTNIPINTVPEMKPTNYIPYGGTALYDAVGYVFDHYKDEKDLIVVILTDGEDNESVNYNRDMIANKIALYKNKNWQFIYLGADITLTTQGMSMGVTNDARSVSMSMDFNRLPALLPSISRGITNYRQGAAKSAISTINMTN